MSDNDKVRNLKKLTFIGDITVDRPLLKASRVVNNHYNFDRVFDKLRERFKNTDYLVANFETVCRYSDDYSKDEYMLLNAPDELIDAVHKANIDCLTTSNNHCMDQNIDGLTRTLDLLDRVGIDHVGTYRSKDEYDNIFIKDFAGFKIAILAATYSINESNIDFKAKKKEFFYNVDMLKSPVIEFSNGFKGKLKETVIKTIPAKYLRAIRRIVSRRKIQKKGSFFKAFVDKEKDNDFNNEYLDAWLKKIDRAKSMADYVFVCPHFGGQFNPQPGTYSNKLMDLLLEKEVFVVGNHPHLIQKIQVHKDLVGAYSIGSFNMSISGDYIIHDNKPAYSLGLNFYFDSDGLVKRSYSIFKIIEDDLGQIEVYPITDLYNELDEVGQKKLEEDLEVLHKRLTQGQSGISEEYFF